MSGDDLGPGAVGTPTPGPPSYDAAELRGRMAACLTVREIRKLAEELGVTGITVDRGTADAARDLVRACERRGGLAPLVAALQRAQPLVEWPEPLPGPLPQEQVAPLLEPLPEPLPEPQASPEPLPEPQASPEPQAQPRPEPLPQPQPAPLPRAPEVTPPAEPPIVDPYQAGGAGWPGTVPAPRDEPSRGLDPRILVVVAALMLAAVGLAFVAGRAFSTSPEPMAAGAAPARPDSVAARAAAAVARRVEGVARACEIGGGPADEVMRRAFLQCGPEAAQAAARPSRPGGPGAGPGAAPPDRDRLPAPAPAPQPTRPRPVTAPPPPPVEPGSACLGACDREHRSCKANQCGSEPTQSSLYKGYQDCLATCLRAASRCRLACQ